MRPHNHYSPFALVAGLLMACNSPTTRVSDQTPKKKAHDAAAEKLAKLAPAPQVGPETPRPEERVRDASALDTDRAGGPATGQGGDPHVRIGKLIVMSDMLDSTRRWYLEAAPRVVRKYGERRFVHCYRKQLAIAPGLRGTVTADLLINQQGRVTRADATGVSKQLAQCVAKVFRLITFYSSSREERALRLRWQVGFEPSVTK